jgi:hypothetical protein
LALHESATQELIEAPSLTPDDSSQPYASS